jgi:hypothetical protein
VGVGGGVTCISSTNPFRDLNYIFVLEVCTKCCYANCFGFFTLLFQNTLPVYNAEHLRRLKILTTLQQKPDILQILLWLILVCCNTVLASHQNCKNVYFTEHVYDPRCGSR